MNPASVRALQGKKTDRIDARRIAEYLQYGLLSGKTGRAILRELAEGQVQPEVLADRAVGSLRSKIPALILAWKADRTITSDGC